MRVRQDVTDLSMKNPLPRLRSSLGLLYGRSIPLRPSDMIWHALFRFGLDVGPIVMFVRF